MSLTTILYTECLPLPKSKNTVFDVRNVSYKAPKVESVFPMDAELNLPQDLYSHGLRCRVAEEVAGHSFDEAVENIVKTTGGKVPKRQTEEVAVCAARDFNEFYSGREAETPEATSDILVLTVDQKGMVMREEDLRPATRKAAEKAEHQPGARLNPGQKLNRKRMATVASVYTIEARERTPEMVMGLADEDKPDRSRCRNKRVWASVEQEPEVVIQDMFDEALRRDPEKSAHGPCCWMEVRSNWSWFSALFVPFARISA